MITGPESKSAPPPPLSSPPASTAARHDGGSGVIEVDGRSCYVDGGDRETSDLLRRDAERLASQLSLPTDWRAAGYSTPMDAARAIVGGSGNPDLDELAAQILVGRMEAE